VSEPDETAAVAVDPPPKKFTPRKKQLCNKDQEDSNKEESSQEGEEVNTWSGKTAGKTFILLVTGPQNDFFCVIVALPWPEHVSVSG
jgi:hypothetical protein